MGKYFFPARVAGFVRVQLMEIHNAGCFAGSSTRLLDIIPLMVLWLKTSCFFFLLFFVGRFRTFCLSPSHSYVDLDWLTFHSDDNFSFFLSPFKVMGSLSWKRPSEFVCYNVSSAVKSIQHLHLWYERNMHKYMYISTPFTAYMYIYRYILSIQYVLCITYSSHQIQVSQ